MEESVGMITAMNEITQDSRRTGTALKTISANMAGVTTSAKDGTIQTNKAAKALKEIAGIDVWNKQTGEIKDMYSVMDELNGKWGDLSEAQRNALASTIAGKTQLNTFNALMSNWDTARQYVKEYKEGLMVGSAERENEQYLDSIAGKWNVIKENMKAVGNTLITSDMAKGFLDIGIVLSEGFNKGIQGITKGISLINKGELGKSISDSLYGALEGLNLDNKFSNTLTDMIGNLGQGLFDNLKTGIFGKLFGGFGNSIKPIFDIFSKITDALPDDSMLGKLGNKISEIKDLANYKLFGGEKELNKQIDGRNENINAIKSEVQSLKNQKQAIEDILPTYEKLTQKTKLSASESQQLAEMRNQLADSNPDLVLGYDQNGTPILKNLQLQNKQLESQIKLKQQSQRLEENSLALDTLQRQTLGQKEFNKAYKEYNDMQLASDTKRKEGLFGKESMQDYAKRIIDDNKKITEDNQKSYEQRLKDHQQYVQDEKAIQQKYMNEMTQKASFKRLSDEMKSGMLTFMDALDWSKFSPAEGSQFAGMLANLGDKLVPTTEAMGKQSKAITQLTQDYANGKTNLIDYTKGLTEQYEAAGKFDTESFTAWRQGLQSYVDTTGDLQGANKAINEMATSLNKITGIKTDTWKTALSFDPAPIDASNKALQKFLNSYGTGVQNLGKGGMADKLTSQFETLQNSYTQMTSDLASGKEIDVEYLVNAKVNQPEPISNLIDEIIADNKVTEEEIDLLLTAQAEILNTGEISDETIKQIADTFNMTEEEVRLMLNVKTEVKEEGQPLEEVKSKWESIDIGEKILSLVQKVTGGELVESAKSTWDSMNIGEKIQTLIQMVTGGDLLGSAAQLFAGINVGQKIQELLQKVTGSDLVKSAGEWFSSLNVGQKIQELLQKVTGSDLVKSAGQWFNSLNVGQKIQELVQKATGSDLLKSAASFFSGIFQGTKNQTLEQKATGSEAVKEASNAMESLPSVKEVTISFIQSGKGLLDSISGFFKSKTEEKISVSVQVTGKEQVESVKNAISSMQNKNISLNVSGNALSQVNQIKSALNGLQTKNISINANGNALSQINSIKSALSGIQTKNISINASGNALGQINSIKSALAGLQSKSISINASVGGTAQVNALKASIASLQGKSVSVSCSTSGTAQVNALTSAIARVNGKTVSVKANVSGTAQVNALINAINRVKSKSVKVSASVSGTGAVQGLASAIASVRSKSVSVSVTKKVTTVQQSVSASATPISATPMLMNTPLADIPVSASDSTVDVPVSVSASATSGFNIGNILPSLNFNINMFKSLEDALENLSTQLSVIDKKSENAFGVEKIRLLQQQIPILKQQQAIQEKIAQGQREQNSELTNWLKGKGFTFDALGNIANYNDKLLAMEQNVESLKKKYDDLNDAESKNESAIKSVQKAYDSASEELSKTKGYLDDYFDTNNTEVLKATEKWHEYENAIVDVQNELQKLKDELKELNIDSGYKNIERDMAEIQNQLDMNELLLDRAEGQEAIELLQERIRLTQQLQNEVGEMLQYETSLKNDLIAELQKYGLQFRDDGSIVNYSNAIANLKQTLSETEFDLVFKKVEEYLKKVMETIPELRLEIQKLNNEMAESKDDIQEIHDNQAEELANALEEAAQAAEEAAKKAKELAQKQFLESITNALERVNSLLDLCKNKMDLLDAKNENSNGAKKIEYLYDKINILNEQITAANKNYNELMRQASKLKGALSSYGFGFDVDGTLYNYESILNSLVGTDDYNYIKDLADQYMDIITGDLLEMQEEAASAASEIENIRLEIEKVAREMRLFVVDNKLNVMNERFEELSLQLDRINSQLEYMYGMNKANALAESIDLMNQQLDLQAKKIASVKKKMEIYQSDLMKYGFDFDLNGVITNYEEIMNGLRDSNSMDEILEAAEEYFDLQSELKDVIADYYDLETAIKDVYKQQLEITQGIEEEITEIYKKEYERRKEELEKYHDARIKMLEDEKKAYQEMRNEQKYSQSVDNQLKEIEALRKQIETARRDTSISGQKRLAELTKELAEAEKELAEITQEKIDQDYEKNIEDEIDKLEQEQEKLLASLDEKFSETNIAKMVAQAMSTGFIEINGEVQTLQSALIQAIDDSAEGYSVMAEIIKNELVANLNVALDTMKELSSIYNVLGSQNFGVIPDTNLEFDTPYIPTGGSSNSNITFGDTIININGSVDEDILEEIQQMINENNHLLAGQMARGL